MWHPIHYIYYILLTLYDIKTVCVDYTTLDIYMTSFAIRKTSHPLYHKKPQYLWCHIHFRHDMKPTISDMTPIVSLSSQTFHWYHTHFCVTSNPLCVRHHMHYIKHHIHSLCHHTTVLMTSQPLYMKLNPLCRATYTLYMWHHSHKSGSSHPLFVWHPTWLVYGISHTIQDITSSVYDIKPPFLGYHSHCIWHHIHCICVITSTVLMISHNCIYEISSAIYDDTVCIVNDITFTIFLT